MFYKFKQFKAILAAKNSENIGDFAILKSDFLGAKVSPEIASKLQQVVGYHPAIDLVELSQYPQDTFGRKYADHMQANHLKPLNVSPELEDVARRNVFALRYTVTHDIFHVLLGFDTSYAGEIGVLAFAAEQNYSKSLKISLWFARLLYPILAPWQMKAIFINLQKGRKLAKKADFLLGYRFENHWQEPIHEVIKRLGLSEIPTIEPSQYLLQANSDRIY
ncbi:hypothetical protein I8751_13640 [Nostocaceae cyanobacterium CENA357]|uniref:Ubiquinone biosynthesis protein n=1 Tax=Atlanticothrix silvestris CENA357 TaxID=1725252 RepID=A0A8J7HJ27_9CYAN|nr:Coq4 family protein [Atlanticothrix silvestris]MBH8553398.1 hypothetical protein [Atlanticothrix silvestris CENA357]